MTNVPSTPSLVIDLPTATRNIERLAKYGKEHRLAIRPHTKTHKSIGIAKLQLLHGADGLTVAKVGEAEVMREASDDLFIAYPIFDAARLERLTALAKTASMRVAIDSTAAASAISSAAHSAGVTIGILVDLDVGFHRTGLQTPDLSLQLAQLVDRLPGLRLDGLFTYPGHIFTPVAAQLPELQRIDQLIQEARLLWKTSGLEMRVVSGGSTPTAYQSHHVTSLTEIRPGTSVYNDMNCVMGGYCTLDNVAARFTCTVVSDAVPGKVVIDAGTKTFTSDRNAAQPDFGNGYLIEYPEARIVRCSEEHGEVNIANCPRAPKLGERVTVIPNHICPCINLQDRVFVRTEDGKLEPWSVDARGKLT